LPWTTLFSGADIRKLPAPEVARKVWLALEQINPDVVLAGPIAFTPGATAVRWCRTRRRGVVVMDDARSQDVPRSALVNWVKRRVFANVDSVFIPAASHRATYQALGIRSQRIFYGMDVIDNEWFAKRAATARDAASPSLRGTPLPERFFLGVGRQVSKKNWRQLLTAYANLKRDSQTAPWDLVLVGGGSDHDVLMQQARDLNVPGIHFLPFLSPEEVVVLYARAQCVVLPSVYGETWGLVINEAMACGCPVLVSGECGCAQTLVESGNNGWTFSPHDPSQLTGAMSRMMRTTPDRRAEMGQRSKQIIDGWGLDRFARGAWQAIESCAADNRGFRGLGDRLLLNLWKGRYRPS
jgi:glycosyltransferase involved in cell wall biosynthesis